MGMGYGGQQQQHQQQGRYSSQSVGVNEHFEMVSKKKKKIIGGGVLDCNADFVDLALCDF
jgi:hypothetical protein